MPKTYICKHCGKEIRAYAVPNILEELRLCADCYKAKYLTAKRYLEGNKP